MDAALTTAAPAADPPSGTSDGKLARRVFDTYLRPRWRGLVVALLCGLVIAGLLPAQLTLYAALAACGLVYLLVAGHLGRLTR